jgi:hypothetical protein
MSSSLFLLDNHNDIIHKNLQYGEKGHVEYAWSNEIRERIIQLNFQLVRTDSKKISKLQDKYEQLIGELLVLKHNFGESNSFSLLQKEVAFELLKILYKMIGLTRDIIDGKGEYTLSYMMIYSWYTFSPELTCYALNMLVHPYNGEHPYGSWKDMKYFCNYCISQGLTKEHFLIHYVIILMNDQLKEDLQKVEQNNKNQISLVAKWIPRERSEKFGWLFEKLAIHFFPNYIETANTDESMKKAILKCKTEFRKIISFLNKSVDTLQIKQCNHQWSKIDFQHVTSISLAKQNKSFLNMKGDGSQRTYLEDRIHCADHFKEFTKKVIEGEVKIKGKRIGLNDFTKEALKLMDSHDQNHDLEKDILNAQWKDHSNQNTGLGKMIAMVDVSASMEGDPMHAAIALGIRIAEKSALGKRVMTFSSIPQWVNLQGPHSEGEEFTDMVKKVKSAAWGQNTNFYAALDMILNALIETKMSPEDAQDLMLVVFSDMQMDEASAENKQDLYSNMKKKYEQAGIRIHGKPYKPPHILFWNLRSTEGFPTLSTQPNCSMMSGFSPVLLNTFCELGMNALQACTPWSLFMKNIENDRYKPLGIKCSEVWL